MKKSRHLPFYLPNYSSNAHEQPIYEPEDNLYNNPDENEGQIYTCKKLNNSKSLKNDEKSRFDEI